MRPLYLLTTHKQGDTLPLDHPQAECHSTSWPPTSRVTLYLLTTHKQSDTLPLDHPQAEWHSTSCPPTSRVPLYILSSTSIDWHSTSWPPTSRVTLYILATYKQSVMFTSNAELIKHLYLYYLNMPMKKIQCFVQTFLRIISSSNNVPDQITFTRTYLHIDCCHVPLITIRHPTSHARNPTQFLTTGPHDPSFPRSHFTCTQPHIIPERSTTRPLQPLDPLFLTVFKFQATL